MTIRPTPAPVAVVLGALGGVATWLAFPPHDHWYLLPLGLAALTCAILTRRAAVAALAALTWGVGFFLPLTAWADIYAGTAPWVALAVVESAYIVVYALAARAVMVRRGLGAGSAIVVACLWTGMEAVRSHWPWGGLPWGAGAFALQSSPLLNLGPWIGTAGLTAVLALLGQLLAGGMLSLLGRREHPRMGGLHGVWPLACAAVLVLACVVVPLPGGQHGGQSMRIAGIQGGVPRIDPQDLAMPAEIFPNSLARTAEVAARSRSEDAPLDLVVWPEDSVSPDPRQDPQTGQLLTAAAADAQAPILVGTQTLPDPHTRYNMSLLWTADGTVAAQYAKRHPVPFGEYIPARSFFRALSDKVDLVSVDMAPGTRVGVMPVGSARVGVLICFEIAYENLVQDVVAGGSQVIVVQTNTALFGDSDEAAQQLGEARVLAVVSGRSVVAVATAGQSAIIAPDGRILSSVGHWDSGAVVADVPLRTGITPAMAAGPWIAVILGLLGAAGLLTALARTREPRALTAPTPRRTR